MQIFVMVHFSGKKIAKAFIKILKESGTQEKATSVESLLAYILLVWPYKTPGLEKEKVESPSNYPPT